jgi:hypothetical protein
VRRQISRIRYQPGDRLWLAALSRLVPRRRWGEVFAVTPATLLAPGMPGQGAAGKLLSVRPAGDVDDPAGRTYPDGPCAQHHDSARSAVTDDGDPRRPARSCTRQLTSIVTAQAKTSAPDPMTAHGRR